MEGNITLNEKWLALSTYLEGYFYDQGVCLWARGVGGGWGLP